MMVLRNAFGARDRHSRMARAGRRAKSIIGVSPVSRNDGWISANGSARKIRLQASIVALGGDGDTGETPMIP
jgi:hypothetical protein